MTTDLRRVLRKIDDQRWELPTSYEPGMRVPGIVYASEAMLRDAGEDKALEQVANVAFLPGIEKYSLAMPDIHWGYGFPVGGVAATRVTDGVVSPGGVGFDINCGVRMLRTRLREEEVRPVLEKLVSALYAAVPSGVGSEGPIRLKGNEIDQVMVQGARWSVKQGYGDAEDLEVTEEAGCVAGADPKTVHQRPRERGAGQLGTLGSGNHFLEVEVVDEVYDSTIAEVLGVEGPGQVMVLFHCGSRGFGHQVCEDYVRIVEGAMKRSDIQVPDRQLACAPLDSPEGLDYLAAMRCAMNFAWANRQAIAHAVRENFSRVFGRYCQELGLRQVY
ncbi:MAG: RtcB family protein, partial [Chloroflexi bacterium]|nr:RtcB family protein [Chloroflexota bacterium]